jgi:hypothetical protein
MHEANTSTLPYIFMVWCLVKHRDNSIISYSNDAEKIILMIDGQYFDHNYI